MEKKIYKFWWYWNLKTQTLPTNMLYFDKKYTDTLIK